MLGFLKRHRKDYDDVEDIRSNVLGNDFFKPQPAPEPDFPQVAAQPRRAADRFPGIEEPVRFEDPPGFNSVDTRFNDRSDRFVHDKQGSYDIMDRLNLIESQLTAIRSQTETINERLKNLETRLTRRY